MTESPCWFVIDLVNSKSTAGRFCQNFVEFLETPNFIWSRPKSTVKKNILSNITLLPNSRSFLAIPNLQDFTLDMYFRQFWTDPRLSFERREGLEKLVVGAEYINLIWVPDTFFVNEKTAYFHKATTENQFLRILHTGEILRSIRYFFTNNSHRTKLGLKMHWKNVSAKVLSWLLIRVLDKEFINPAERFH